MPRGCGAKMDIDFGILSAVLDSNIVRWFEVPILSTVAVVRMTCDALTVRAKIGSRGFKKYSFLVKWTVVAFAVNVRSVVPYSSAINGIFDL